MYCVGPTSKSTAYIVWAQVKVKRETADGLRWAHFRRLKILPKALNGPILSVKDTAYVLELAHCCQPEKPPMTLGGPIAVGQIQCGKPLMASDGPIAPG
jgi:hypothetical protein